MQRTEQKTLLPIGIPVYSFSSPHLHSFCLSLYLRGGSLHEDPAFTGVTHFIEHLVFRSINRHMGGTLYSTLDRLGLAIEGVTFREFVQFSVTGSPAHFAQAVRILSLALAPLLLTKEDLETERDRIKAEIREEGERNSLDFFTDGILYGKENPLSRPITGTAGTLSRMSLSFLKAEKARLFSKENLFFYATGCIPENAADALAEATAVYTLPSDSMRENTPPVPRDFFKRDASVFVKPSKKTLVRLSFDIDTTRYSDAALTLLYDLLFGDGEQCFLHQALSEQTGMIYSFRGHLDLYRGIGVIGVSYEITPGALLPSLSLALDAIRRAKTGAKAALPYLRAPYIDNAPFLLDDAAALGFNRAYETQILNLPYRSLADRAAAYEAVTGEMLAQMAKEIFCSQNATLTLKAGRVDTAALHALLASL